MIHGNRMINADCMINGRGVGAAPVDLAAFRSRGNDQSRICDIQH